MVPSKQCKKVWIKNQYNVTSTFSVNVRSGTVKIPEKIFFWPPGMINFSLPLTGNDKFFEFSFVAKG